MFDYGWPALILAILLVAAVGLRWRPRRRPSRPARLVEAKRWFHTQREGLEAKFIRLASNNAGPEAPRWIDCFFDDDVCYVRSRRTGELSALVAMSVATENFNITATGAADAVGNLQAGTAVFRFDQDHWETDGRAILNLSPTEAVHYFGDDMEIVGEEPAHHRT